jgi:hypothetical protein
MGRVGLKAAATAGGAPPPRGGHAPTADATPCSSSPATPRHRTVVEDHVAAAKADVSSSHEGEGSAAIVVLTGPLAAVVIVEPRDTTPPHCRQRPRCRCQGRCAAVARRRETRRHHCPNGSSGGGGHHRASRHHATGPPPKTAPPPPRSMRHRRAKERDPSPSLS